VERQPTAATPHELDERDLLLGVGAHVAGVGDEEVGLGERVEAVVRLVDAGLGHRVLGEGGEQLQPRVIEIVPPAAAHEYDVDPACGSHDFPLVRVNAPLILQTVSSNAGRKPWRPWAQPCSRMR